MKDKYIFWKYIILSLSPSKHLSITVKISSLQNTQQMLWLRTRDTGGGALAVFLGQLNKVRIYAKNALVPGQTFVLLISHFIFINYIYLWPSPSIWHKGTWTNWKHKLSRENMHKCHTFCKLKASLINFNHWIYSEHTSINKNKISCTFKIAAMFPHFFIGSKLLVWRGIKLLLE